MEKAKNKVLFNKLWMGILLLAVMLMANMSVTANAQGIDDFDEDWFYLRIMNYTVNIPKGQTFNPKMLGYSMEYDCEAMTEGVDYQVSGVIRCIYDEDDQLMNEELITDYSKLVTGSYYLEIKGIGAYEGGVWREEFFLNIYENGGTIQPLVPVSLNMAINRSYLYKFTAASAGLYTFCSNSAVDIDPDPNFFNDANMTDRLDNEAFVFYDIDESNMDFRCVYNMKANQTIYLGIYPCSGGNVTLYVAPGNLTKDQAIAATNAAEAARRAAAEAARIAALPPAVNSMQTVGNQVFQVLAGQTVGFVSAQNAKNVTVPDAVTLKGRSYPVVSVGPKAFKGSKIKAITIGKNVKKIGANAFKGSKAKTLILKTKNLNKKSVKGSLKGSKIKTIKVKVGNKKVNKKFVGKYKKIFTKKNAGSAAAVK